MGLAIWAMQTSTPRRCPLRHAWFQSFMISFRLPMALLVMFGDCFGAMAAMPLDPLAKRLLTMMAAAAPSGLGRPSDHTRRHSLAKLMQCARAEDAALTIRDDVLPGPGGPIRFRLYAPADETE